jgi:hypothetical protein
VAAVWLEVAHLSHRGAVKSRGTNLRSCVATLTGAGHLQKEPIMFIAVLVRRLRPDRTYEDFIRAWYPDRGFNIPVRGPLLGVNVADEREILTLSFIDLPSRQDLDEALRRLAEQEAVRHDRLADIIESAVVRAIFEQRDEFDFSSDDSAARGRATFVTRGR